MAFKLLLIGFILLLSFSGCISRWLFLSFSVYYWVVLLVALVINFSYWFIISFILVINKQQEHFFDMCLLTALPHIVHLLPCCNLLMLQGRSPLRAAWERKGRRAFLNGGDEIYRVEFR